MNRQSSITNRQSPACGCTLWDPAPPARRGEDTQQAAALAVAPHTPRMRERVLAYIRVRCPESGVRRDNGKSDVRSPQSGVVATPNAGLRTPDSGLAVIGATNEEIALALGMRLASVCGRVHELAEAGQIRDSGLRRPGASGVGAKVWVRSNNIPGADA